MLVLRRKVGEAIVLNGVITVYVLAVEGERVKLGINAPPDVVIVRQELLDSVAQENRAARKQAQAGGGEPGSEGSKKTGQEPPSEGGSGRRDLRAMLDRALATPDGTLSPRNGHSTE
jgi:carbon storage regulator